MSVEDSAAHGFARVGSARSGGRGAGGPDGRVFEDGATGQVGVVGDQPQRGGGAHRVAAHGWVVQVERLDQAGDVSGVVCVGVAARGLVGEAVAAGVGHDHVVVAFEDAGDAGPAQAAVGGAVAQDSGGLSPLPVR